MTDESCCIGGILNHNSQSTAEPEFSKSRAAKFVKIRVVSTLYPMPNELIVLKSDLERFDALQEEFAHYELEAVRWADRERHLQQIRYALVWNPGAGELTRMPNLAVVFSVGAGVDHLIGPDIVPGGLPVVRMVEESLTAGMVEYVVYQILRWHREMALYEKDQNERIWCQRMQQSATTRSVGILGMGELGGAVATALSHFGFKVSGWSRSPKELAGVTSFHGQSQLDKFLGQTEFLVCLLPLTDATRGIVDQTLISSLPNDAYIINAGRGGLVNDNDLLAALDSGKLQGACLDVFNEEPLPVDSRYWGHPNVTITPHIASMTIPETSIRQVMQNIERFRSGAPLEHLADLVRGY